MQYIYMSEDTKHTPATSLIIFKVGHSKHPILRGGQLKQAARRTIGQEVQMCIRNHYIETETDNLQEVKYIEKCILDLVARRPSAVRLSPEFFIISAEDRAACYKHLPQWVRIARRHWKEQSNN